MIFENKGKFSKCVKDRKSALYHDIEKNKVKNIIEIGVHDGKDFAVTAIRTALNSLQEGEKCKYIGFDLFSENMTQSLYEKEFAKMPPLAAQVYSLISEIDPARVEVDLVAGNTHHTLQKWMSDNAEKLFIPDLIHIDGGHSRETMMNDWNFAKHFFSLNKNLIVWFDDYNVFANKSDQRVWSCDFIVDDLDENVYDVMINDEYEEYNRFRATNARVSLKK